MPSINGGLLFCRRELIRADLSLLVQVTARLPKGTARRATMNLLKPSYFNPIKGIWEEFNEI